MTLDFNFNLKDLDGAELTPAQNAGKHAATAMVTQPHGNALKMWDWAVALNSGKPIEVDNADFEVIQKFIETSVSLTILSKHQLLQVMKEAKK
jgi:hypothetical protein